MSEQAQTQETQLSNEEVAVEQQSQEQTIPEIVFQAVPSLKVVLNLHTLELLDSLPEEFSLENLEDLTKDDLISVKFNSIVSYNTLSTIIDEKNILIELVFHKDNFTPLFVKLPNEFLEKLGKIGLGLSYSDFSLYKVKDDNERDVFLPSLSFVFAQPDMQVGSINILGEVVKSKMEKKDDSWSALDEKGEEVAVEELN